MTAPQGLQASDPAALLAVCGPSGSLRHFDCRRPPRRLLAAEHLAGGLTSLLAACGAVGFVLGHVRFTPHTLCPARSSSLHLAVKLRSRPPVVEMALCPPGAMRLQHASLSDCH